MCIVSGLFLGTKTPAKLKQAENVVLIKETLRKCSMLIAKLSLAMSGVYGRSRKITGRVVFGAMMLNALIYRKNKNQIIRLGDKEQKSLSTFCAV